MRNSNSSLIKEKKTKKKNGIFWSKLDLIFIGFHTKNCMKKIDVLGNFYLVEASRPKAADSRTPRFQ